MNLERDVTFTQRFGTRFRLPFHLVIVLCVFVSSFEDDKFSEFVRYVVYLSLNGCGCFVQILPTCWRLEVNGLCIRFGF